MKAMKHFWISFWQNKLERFFKVTHTQSFHFSTGQGTALEIDGIAWKNTLAYFSPQFQKKQCCTIS